MKKILAFILSSILLLSCMPTLVSAQDNITVYVDDSVVEFDVQPTTINDRTMVPLRAIFEALGADVDWDDETQTVSANKDDNKISLTIDIPEIRVNGTLKELDVAPILLNDRTLVPVRAISEAFGYLVEWDEETKTVFVKSGIPAKSAFESLKDYIVENASLFDEGVMGVAQQADAVSITYAMYFPEDNVISFSFYVNVSETQYVECLLTIYGDDEKLPTCDLVYEGENYFDKLTGTFDAETFEFTETQSNIPSDLKDLVYLNLHAQLEMMDLFLVMNEIDARLEDFGVKYNRSGFYNDFLNK